MTRRGDNGARPLPPEHRAGLHPVGRLDADSHGALLLTDLGELTLKLTHPRYSHTKTYRVWVEGRRPKRCLDRWRRGVLLMDAGPSCAGASVADVGRPVAFGDRAAGRAKPTDSPIAEALGHPVLDLQRTAIAGLSLGDLAEGAGTG